MMNPYPKSMVTKVATPGSRGGLAKQMPIKSGPTVQQPFVSGRRIAQGKKTTAASFAKKASNPRIKSRGGAKIAQGGEKERSPSSSGLSRTNKGRQRL